ncbi:pyridoxal phosphate-dependent aminotransferase [Geoalkalibacter halelectricus]|uniref:Pyridoxal phosphate-dependent aminotransferase n=1 Tax=Geoalkalibacter halelectricus TaxID=2847045 RepID=A0ABY5ZHV2_9BACT|nr:pyridoxal phosphate-dependent aminotransferase [Geoalkalibacter halelectricus]MDO3379432.1 pyridoxal phosphate-dependent aminotransferase [Geoalkalibacter halelectricus]UWZ78691.1 pyridoxal phosphate-dependent aminotransferase [Geoalkalibacter halelectricus]
MAIADKVQGCIERSSWIRKMFEEGAALREKYGADNVFDFTLGNPAVEPPEAFRAQLLELAQRPLIGMHRYMNNAGHEQTRAAVAEILAEKSGLPVAARHVIMTCGAGGALNVILKTILNPGEEVIILTPYFVEYKFYIDNHGGVPVEVWTNRDTFQPDIDAIAAAIGPKTRALILNSPNNPTGVIYPRETLAALGRMLEEKEKELGRQIYVISDEPYARLSYDDKQVPAIFACIRNAVIATSHSKDLALPGERIGYLAANPQMREIELFMEGAVFCNRVLGFVNAPALMQLLVAGLQRASVDVAEYQHKRDVLYNHLSKLGFEMVKPDGGFYLFPKSPLADDVEFVKTAQRHNLLLVPGSGFGAPGFFRIAYCVDLAMIERSLPAWDKLAAETLRP